MTTKDNQGNDAGKKHHLFEDISVVQVTATALAAVTSMLLSTYIGIAGSVIGVAVASIVSTMAASLYKHFLKESAEKIKEIPAVGKTHSLIEHATAAITGNSDEDNKRSDGSVDITDKDDTTSPKQKSSTDASPSKSESPTKTVDSSATIPLDELSVQSSAITVPIAELQMLNDISNSSEKGNSTEGIEVSSEPKPNKHDDRLESDIKRIESDIDTDERISKEAEEAILAKKRMKIGLIAVCVISALIAVVLSAAIIYITSHGEGIGVKPQSIFTPTQTASDPGDFFDDIFGTGDHSLSSSSASSSSSMSSSASSESSSATDSSSASSSSAGSSSESSSEASSSGSSSDASSSDASSSSSSSDAETQPSG